ncbi:phage tail tape measure protein [Pseudomonas sp. 09C 129]|uniref:phage tail tape measure protein n=1 Tax=Pseudomonas sp. 09C 129 TaxID=2054915 RepID=UPI000C6E2372|nr:phage tail tape measure protein [Pseudomonas sp. 09C 129]AUF99790.1 phage tail tape measure protein [Pseudomonas sp. 09C 129]
MGRDLKLEVVLQAIDRVTRPIRAITQGSIGLGRALKDSRDQLKQLQAQQADISSWRTLRAASEQTDTALQAARDRVKALGRDMASTGAPTRQMTRDLKAAIREATALKKQHQEQQVQLQGLRTKLGAAGISTRNLSQQERDLRQRIDQTNQTISEQTKRMQALSRQARQTAAAKAQFEKAQHVAGSMAAGGAAGVASGYALAKPLQGMVDAFAPAENAATQLKVAMMDKNGQVAADFTRITELANGLGDRLPGTTADFQEMMTMLRRQGISSQSILGGTGEAAAYLGVQLQKPVTAAAEFAAKMQDATRTPEKDMMSLMDTIQRAYYLGVDDNNMLQGFSKISPVMDIIKKQGLEAANTFAPLLVMMDQTGMAGESAGNAYRKVFQGAMDTSKIKKTLDDLKTLKGIDLSLNFTDGKGEFGSIKQMYAQLSKLNALNTETRLQLIKDLFGDDSETLQVLNTMMSKGIAGYDEVAAKMKDQADLRTRVNEQLSTLTNTIEAAQGSWTNAMSEIGATIAPELKDLINDLGNVAVSVKEWVKANPGLTAAIFKTAAGLALLLAVGGAIGIMLASMLGPFAIVRYALTLIGIKSLGAAAAFKGVGAALLWVGKAILLVGRALLMNPIGLVVTAIAAAAYLIYTNWEPVKAFFLGLWAEIKAGFNGGLTGILGLIANFSPIGMFYRAFAAVMNYFGVELPGKFTDFGSMLMQGMVQGITNGLTAVKGAITGAADSTVGWFKEKLGIHSPSRVFAELGGFTMAGLEQGLANNQGGPLAAVVDMGKKLVAAGAVTLGMTGPATAMDNQLGAVVDMSKTLTAGTVPPGMTGPAIAMDNRAPLAPASGRSGGVVVQGDTYQITIQATPGTDTAGLRQMLNQLLDERERSKSARVRSALQDKD